MKLISAFAKIKALENPVFRTEDIAIMLGVTNKYGHKILKQLSAENLVLHIKRGLWGVRESLEPLMLPDCLTAPMPSYISLQSALYHHGMISQIPPVVYAVSVARTRRYTTPLCTCSVHHITPELFTGFDTIGSHAIRMASPEKALFDFFYLKAAKSRLFYALPELTLPENFSWKQVEGYTRKINNPARKAMVERLCGVL